MNELLNTMQLDRHLDRINLVYISRMGCNNNDNNNNVLLIQVVKQVVRYHLSTQCHAGHCTTGHHG